MSIREKHIIAVMGAHVDLSARKMRVMKIAMTSVPAGDNGQLSRRVLLAKMEVEA